jgi:hypothetical protein
LKGKGFSLSSGALPPLHTLFLELSLARRHKRFNRAGLEHGPGHQSLFPREVLPISSVLTNVVDLVFSFSLWAVVAAGYSFLYPQISSAYPQAHPFLPHAGWLWLPVIFFFQLLLILGIVFITSTLQVYFRDVGHLISLGLTLWLIIPPRSLCAGFVLRRALYHPYQHQSHDRHY